LETKRTKSTWGRLEGEDKEGYPAEDWMTLVDEMFVPQLWSNKFGGLEKSLEKSRVAKGNVEWNDSSLCNPTLLAQLFRSAKCDVACEDWFQTTIKKPAHLGGGWSSCGDPGGAVGSLQIRSPSWQSPVGVSKRVR
jgi:hypothetical protein